MINTAMLSPIKQELAIAAQTHLNELKDKVSELDIGLLNIGTQIDVINSSMRSLKETVVTEQADISADISNVALIKIFSKIQQRFTSITSRLRHFITIDWITKGLLLEVTSLMERMIDEYFSETQSITDWESLQQELFGQIEQHLSQSSRSSDDSGFLFSIETESDNELNNGMNDPFHLDNALEGLHLFDQLEQESLDQEWQQDEDLTTLFPSIINDFDNFIEVNNEDNSEINNANNIDFDDFLEVNLEVNNEDNSEINNEDNINGQVIHEGINQVIDRFIEQPEQESSEVVPMPEILADIFLSSEAFPSDEEFSDSDDETELQGFNWGNQDLDLNYSLEVDTDDDEQTASDDWQQFDELYAWSNNDEMENSILDQLSASFDLNDDLNDDLTNDLTDSLTDQQADDHVNEESHNFNDLDQLIMGDNNFNEELNALNNFNDFNNLDSFSNLNSLVDYEGTYDFLENVEDQIDQPDEHKNMLRFDMPDIDTAIEESPIYQNNQGSQDHSRNYNHESSFTKSQNFLIDFDNTGNSHDASDRPIRQTNLDPSPDLNVQTSYRYLEKLGDFSEDLLLRKGAIANYLKGIRDLSAELNSNLALLDAKDTAQCKSQLKQNLENLVAVLDRTEQQTELMNSDIRGLNQHLYQSLKCPISSLVAKFPRILHDLSWQDDKQVDLVVQGADIGLEKVVAEAVAEPLNLLLRYCLQHGIETPTERQQQGKPIQGRIEVIASQTDAMVEIKISDDGRNINNLLPDHLVKLCDNVLNCLQPIGASIAVHPAMGSQFILTLPNSLSLMRVLLINVNRMCLAIPSKSVLEVLPMPNNHGRSLHLLEWRNQSLPIVKLDEVLMLNCRHSQDQFANRNYGAGEVENPLPALLVVQSGSKLSALQVDSCWGDQDVTLHPVEGDIAMPQMFMGAVILGNNQAISLLNPSEVMQRSLGQESKAYNGNHNGTHNGANSGISSLSNSLANSLSNSLEPQWTESNLDRINSINNLSDFFNNVEESPAPIEPLEPAALSRQIKVLIVESSANVRRYLAMTLGKCGFLTEQAQDSHKAIALVKAKQRSGIDIDVVITDLEMPQMDGFKLLSSMRDDPDLQNLPIVVLTSHNNENDQKLALELGAKASFCKPYREQELVETLIGLTQKDLKP
jgi:chemotaxis protein histidine kinase CheA/ActR/RegA family two-component response regulator